MAEELLYVWKPAMPPSLPLDPAVVGPSTAEAVWTIPKNTPPGRYRLRHEGTSQSGPGSPMPYSGTSGVFVIASPSAACP